MNMTIDTCPCCGRVIEDDPSKETCSACRATGGRAMLPASTVCQGCGAETWNNRGDEPQVCCCWDEDPANGHCADEPTGPICEVVNVGRVTPDIYIGRRRGTAHHWGNPFTHRSGATLAEVQVRTREEAISRYETWLRGESDTSLEQERSNWICDQIRKLRAEATQEQPIKLGCFCAPIACHGDVLRRMIERGG